MNEKLQVYDTKMQKTLHSLDAELATIRAGRANPHILDKLTVDYYGSATPIQQVANISVPEPRMILIQPWEKKLIKDIEKAILTSDLGINPNNDGSAVRLIFPRSLLRNAVKIWQRMLRKRARARRLQSAISAVMQTTC